MNIVDWLGLTQVCDCQDGRNDHDTNILTPHDPTTVDLRKFSWVKRVIDATWMVYAYYDALGGEVNTRIYYHLDNVDNPNPL